MRLTFCYRHIAPYHNAQLSALAQSGCTITVINYANSCHAAFDELSTPYKTFEVINVSGPEWNLDELHASLKQSRPDLLLVPGWGHAYALSALSWASAEKIPCIVISDSQVHDHERNIVQEAIKRKVVRLFSAAFVAGVRSRSYLLKLGMAAEKISVGCNVVDNDHFTQGAIVARENAVTVRNQLGLPQRYFLAVCRLVQKKNLPTIIKAYAAYCSKGHNNDLDLVIVGDGPLRVPSAELAKQLGISDRLHFKGSRQYEDMPAFYGLATALVLASISEPWGLVVNEAMSTGLPVIVSQQCGCVPELVRNRINGFIFNPLNVDELISMMTLVASEECDIEEMGRQSRSIIAEWSLKKYVSSLLAVIEVVRHVRLPKSGIKDRILLATIAKKILRRQGQ
jgi:glycosyltransferase involved in cell wall biosynthesis